MRTFQMNDGIQLHSDFIIAEDYPDAVELIKKYHEFIKVDAYQIVINDGHEEVFTMNAEKMAENRGHFVVMLDEISALTFIAAVLELIKDGVAPTILS